SVLLSLEGLADQPVILTGSGVLHQVSRSGSTWLVLMVGSVDSIGLLEVKAASVSATPTAVVLDASAGEGAGYQRLEAGEVRIDWQRQ
ncbi:MAG TPA: hypothetical protein PLL69_02550, partial [Gemmatimonadales bacterium]|nr:hypothetical protein [Gemmatimonadales bacterium]